MPPVSHDKPTEALFAVVRSELAGFVRYSAFHTDFNNPALKSIAQPQAPRDWPVSSADGDDLMPIETGLEECRLATCDPENPFHFMTIWIIRSALARNRLLQYYSQQCKSPLAPTVDQCTAALAYALELRMVECDRRLRGNSRIKSFPWFVDTYPPAVALNCILDRLRKCPDEGGADEAWTALSANYKARSVNPSCDKHRTLNLWVPIVLYVWRLRKIWMEQQNRPPREAPRIVMRMREQARQMDSGREQTNEEAGNFVSSR